MSNTTASRGAAAAAAPASDSGAEEDVNTIINRDDDGTRQGSESRGAERIDSASGIEGMQAGSEAGDAGDIDDTDASISNAERDSLPPVPGTVATEPKFKPLPPVVSIRMTGVWVD